MANNETHICPACQLPIHADATRCPHCSKKQQNPLAFLVGCGCGLGCAIYLLWAQFTISALAAFFYFF